MSVPILIVGSVSLEVLYSFFGPTDIDNFYVIVTPIEGATFAALVLFAFRPIRPLNAVLVVVISAAANMSLLLFWAFLSVIPTLVADLLELSGTSRIALLIGWLAVVGALIFCSILDFVGRLPIISAQTYYWTMALAPFSAIPFLISGIPTLALHKTLWWLFFSAALILTNRREPTNTITANTA